MDRPRAFMVEMRDSGDFFGVWADSPLKARKVLEEFQGKGSVKDVEEYFRWKPGYSPKAFTGRRMVGRLESFFVSIEGVDQPVKYPNEDACHYPLEMEVKKRC